MSQQNGGTPDRQQPWLDSESTSSTPRVFPFGTPAQGEQPAQGQTEPGSAPQQWGQAPQGSAPQQWDPRAQNQQPGQQPAQSYPDQPVQGSQPQQWDPQAAQGSQPQQWGAPAEPFGSGPQHAPQQPPQMQSAPQGQQPQQWNDPAPAPVGQAQGSQGSQQFSGILDPHTGEIHPVPDLQNLDETDALLVVVSGPDAGAQILLDTDVVTVGRSPNADIFLDDVTVSRKHAEFVRTPSGFTLRDTGSLNGTYVGRQLIDSIELQNGADVQIGKFRMIFQQRPRTS